MKKFFVPAMLALLLFTAGCEQPPTDKPPATPPAQTKTDVSTEPKPESTEPKSEPENTTKPDENSKETNPAEEQTLNVKVYYPDDSGMKLVEVEREIVVDDSTDKYTAAVELLRDDPGEENLTTIFPRNASIRSITIEGSMAIVDFDGSILKGFVGGSTGEEFLIGSIVDTLTSFPEITSVKFLVDGQEVETLSGHMDLSTPLERMGDLTE